jgi:vitamin B12 transporter
MSMKKLFVTTFVLALIQFAKAQTDSSGNLLDDVVVTATKSPKKLSETGKVLTVITREQLQQNSSHSIGEILNQQTGLIVVGSTATPGTNQSVYMRGAGSGNTLILIDGVPVYDASGISSEFDINYININQIERIEILKGAQSTLYGSDAVAGVINIITKKNTYKPVTGFADVSAGSFGTLNTAAGINGRLKNFQYAAGGSYVRTNGISSAYDSTGKANFDKDGFDEYNLNASAGYNISPHFNLRAFAQYNQYKAGIDAGAYTDDKDYNLKNKNTIAGLTGDLNMGSNRLVFNYQYNYIDRSFIDDSTDVPTFVIYQRGSYKSYSHFAEVYNNTAISKHAELLVGADYRYNATSQSYLELSSYGPYQTALGKDSAHTNQGSLYASFFIKDISGFNAEIGGRINNHSIYGWNETYSINPSFNINAHWKVFVNVASAYHVPSLYQLYSEFGNKDLKPEKSQTYEGGMQFTSGKIQSRVVYFKRDIKDVIIFYTDPVTYAGYYINADKQNDNGVEAELSFSPVRSINFVANYTYVNGDVKTQSSGKDTSYFNLYRRPHNVFNFSANWQKDKLTASAKLHATSYFYEAVYGSAPQKFDGYYTVDLYAEYKPAKDLGIFVDARNITDQQYFELPGYNSKRFNIMAGLHVNF